MEEIATIAYPDGDSRILMVARKELLPSDARLTVFDGNTAPLFPDRDLECSLSLPPGETAKNWTSVERIINRALAVELERDGLIVGVGGGVVTDVTAFAASIYMRGCRLVLVPTTLLSMVDAATGGKTGFDFGGVKNLLGTFYPAHEVRICPEILETLPEREFQSGMAEVIKHALLLPEENNPLLVQIRDECEQIRARDPEALMKMIPAAVKVKADVVEADLRERGERAFLNLGHTFAHALEAATNFSRWSHGEAVAWGILRALDLGERIGITDPQWANQTRQLIASYGFDIVTPQVAPEEIKAAMSSDKKKKDGHIRFVMLKGPGQPVLQSVPESDLDAVLGIEKNLES
ncbi:MAG: 3-dehydroquinate synthase [Spirochaetales bacterium]|nr:3-dehydroquinate synthase [Spirochaetales bacterium]